MLKLKIRKNRHFDLIFGLFLPKISVTNEDLKRN